MSARRTSGARRSTCSTSTGPISISSRSRAVWGCRANASTPWMTSTRRSRVGSPTRGPIWSRPCLAERPSNFGVVGVLLLGSLLVGLAHVALLPPFEGFDETGHFSYLQQLAETGRWPVRGDRMSKDIDDYLAVAPSADSTGGRWRYEAFFAAGGAKGDGGQRAIKLPPQSPRVWAPGQGENGQAQHPPLYYLLLAPAYLASKGWSLGTQLLFLRSLSYLIAWAGLCVA